MIFKIKNYKLKSLLKNFSYTLVSNLISILISSIVVIILPKFINVESYGYWQLYVFYTLYIGFLHFGWNDGIYLREGGREYYELDKSNYFTQFYLLIVSQLFFTICGSLFAYFFIDDIDKKFVVYATSFCVIIVNSRYMLLFLLQATNRIKEYSSITIFDRIIYGFIILLLLVVSVDNYKPMIYADLFAKLISLFYAMYLCKDIVLRRISDFKIHIEEIYENIKSGINLMLSTIASKLIIGNVRFGIEYVWSIAVFGKISLILSISGFLMIFINTLGIVLFPFLRKVSSNNLTKIYKISRSALSFALILFLFVYFPLLLALNLWLPKYQDSLMYLSIIFPMCIYESKMSILISTYLKVLRKEKALFYINLIAFMISLITTSMIVFFIKNLNLAVLSIIFLIAIRSIIAEIYISKKLKLSIGYSLLSELFITVSFIYCTWNFNFINSFISYTFIVITYITFNWKNIKNINIKVLDLINNKSI